MNVNINKLESDVNRNPIIVSPAALLSEKLADIGVCEGQNQQTETPKMKESLWFWLRRGNEQGTENITGTF